MMTATGTLFDVDAPQMEIEDFGRRLLETGDLDPIYVMLHRANLEREQLKRWLLAYWFFYHAGVASKLSEFEGPDFFGACLYRVDEKTTPRGTERRHFRGEKAERAILWFGSTYKSAEDAVDYATGLHLLSDAPKIDLTLAPKAQGVTEAEYQEAWKSWEVTRALISKSRNVMERVQTWPQFGPWIAFKVADMLERCLGVHVDFSDCDLLSFYEEPRKAAEILAKRPGAGFTADADANAALQHCLWMFRRNLAPPSCNRPCGIQEVETILCKWKSHLNGHYPVGKDTREIRHALTNWGPLADRLKGCLPE